MQAFACAHALPYTVEQYWVVVGVEGAAIDAPLRVRLRHCPAVGGLQRRSRAPFRRRRSVSCASQSAPTRRQTTPRSPLVVEWVAADVTISVAAVRVTAPSVAEVSARLAMRGSCDHLGHHLLLFSRRPA